MYLHPYKLYYREYRECEHRTYIVKEHYDWLKSSASLSTLKKHVIFFLNTVLACDGLRGIWGHDAGSAVQAQHRDVYQPSVMDDGIRCVWLKAALRRVITVWRKNTARAIRKHKDPSALLSPLLYFDVTQWSFCAALLQVKHTYHLSAQHMASARGEGWAHSELREPRVERTDFHSVDVNYTFELIDKIDLSPSPTAHIHILCKQSLLIVYTLTHSIFLSKLLN